MGVKVNRCDIVPPLSGSAGVPVNAPYLLNGVDPSGLLTAEVNVLALAAPQPFIATAPIAGDVGLPITLAYDNGAGAAGTGVGLQFKAQNDLDTTKDICTVVTRLTVATDTTEASVVDIGVLAAGAEQTALTIADTGLSLNGGTGAKTVTTSKGALTVSATGAGNGVTVSSAAASADLTGTTTATVSAGSGAATLRSTAAGAVVVGQTTASLTATTGAASVVATAGAASITGATTAALTAGSGAATVESTGGAVILVSAAASAVTVTAGGTPTWQFLQSGLNGGALTALGTQRKVANIAPGTVAGDAVAFEQLLDSGIATPTDAGPAVAMSLGATMTQVAEFTAPSGVAGAFLIDNSTGQSARLIDVQVGLPAAGPNTLTITVSKGATVLFTGTTIASPGGTHLQMATTYTTTDALFAAGDDIAISATGNGGTVAVILLLGFVLT